MRPLAQAVMRASAVVPDPDAKSAMRGTCSGYAEELACSIAGPAGVGEPVAGALSPPPTTMSDGGAVYSEAGCAIFPGQHFHAAVMPTGKEQNL
jgi:hypothetical protein